MITFSKLGKFGSIGNQMFQYAALVSIAVKNKYELKIPKVNEYYNSSYNRNERYFTDGFKNISAKVLEDNDLKKVTNFVNHMSPFRFNPEILNVKDWSDLSGYFQSYKYFIDYKDIIYKEFLFKDEIYQEIDAKHKFETSKSTSIHIRGGDYKFKQDYHVLLDKLYYRNALDIIKDENYLVFSDDTPHAKYILNNTNKKFTFVNTGNPFIELALMSLCKNNIIANSTFGWWGAFLNKNKNKIIISPKRWLGPSVDGENSYIKDLIPDDWISI